jgi:hypothetical protein
MQLKDEKKYNDVVDILDYYEQELENIYAKAGVIQKHFNCIATCKVGRENGCASNVLN